MWISAKHNIRLKVQKYAQMLVTEKNMGSEPCESFWEKRGAQIRHEIWTKPSVFRMRRQMCYWQPDVGTSVTAMHNRTGLNLCNDRCLCTFDRATCVHQSLNLHLICSRWKFKSYFNIVVTALTFTHTRKQTYLHCMTLTVFMHFKLWCTTFCYAKKKGLTSCWTRPALLCTAVLWQRLTPAASAAPPSCWKQSQVVKTQQLPRSWTTRLSSQASCLSLRAQRFKCFGL